MKGKIKAQVGNKQVVKKNNSKFLVKKEELDQSCKSLKGNEDEGKINYF